VEGFNANRARVVRVRLRFRLVEADRKNSFAAWSSTRSRTGEDVLEGPLMAKTERVDFGAEKAVVRNVEGGYFNLPRQVVERE